MTYMVEIRATTRRAGAPRLVPLETAAQYRGFRSVYAFPPDVVALIEEAGSVRGMRGLEVYSDVLFTDFDGTDPSPLFNHLDNEGIGYEVYDSGNRSVHVHIKTEPMYGDWVPAAQKAWVRKYAPGADLSFYHPSGQYRLPGTYHVKGGGRCKELVREQPGKALVIEPPVDRPMVPPRAVTPAEAREQLLALAMTRRGVGQRSPHIWLMAKTAAELGMPMDEARTVIEFWNTRFCNPPQDDRTIWRQLHEGYK